MSVASAACGAAVVALVLRRPIARLGAAALAGVALAGGLVVAQLASERSRDVFYSRARFRAWANTWIPFFTSWRVNYIGGSSL